MSLIGVDYIVLSLSPIASSHIFPISSLRLLVKPTNLFTFLNPNFSLLLQNFSTMIKFNRNQFLVI